MVGIKGRSGGKAVTLEEKAKKAAATAVREAKREAARAEKFGPLVVPDATAPDADETTSRLGLPVTWGDELKRRQVEGETIQNRRRAVEVNRAEVELQRAKDEADEARGRLVPRAELHTLAAKTRDVWWAEVSLIPGATILALPDLPGETRARIKQAVTDEVAAAANRVKAKMTT